MQYTILKKSLAFVTLISGKSQYKLARMHLSMNASETERKLVTLEIAIVVSLKLTVMSGVATVNTVQRWVNVRSETTHCFPTF